MENAPSQRRLSALSRHLEAVSVNEDVSSAPCLAPASFDAREMSDFLVRDNRELRARIFDFLKDPLYEPNYYMGVREQRAVTTQRVKAYMSQKFYKIADYVDNPLRFCAGLECPMFADFSTAVKMGVHATLCGGTIASLGNPAQKAKYLARMDTLELAGCFGMTELGHGSNVMGIRTRAEYDPATREFVITTPDDDASKYFIGGAAETAHICCVFAQLTVGGRDEGVHVFVTPLRDASGRVLPGVRIQDNGAKMGLNGVDNGQIWFDGVRVPRDALLDKYGGVDEAGAYCSPLPSATARFGVMVGGLTTGRVLLAQGAVDAMKIGLTIALRYAFCRPQFGDALIGDYVTHRRRLLPALAETYALQLAMQRLKAVYKLRDMKRGKEVHLLSSGLKAAATWRRVQVLQDCRECCGGQGFMADNRFGAMISDMNVDVTFEGDNTVLMQQVARALVEAAGKAAAPRRPEPPLGNAAPDARAARLLLAYRRDSLARELALELAKGGQAAWDASLDKCGKLGWAYADALCAEVLAEELAQAPRGLEAPLELLAELHALWCLDRAAGELALDGLVRRAGAEAVRARVHELCARLAADQGALALALCDGLGVPEHLVRAPIAKDWRTAFAYRG